MAQAPPTSVQDDVLPYLFLLGLPSQRSEPLPAVEPFIYSSMLEDGDDAPQQPICPLPRERAPIVIQGVGHELPEARR